MKILRKFKKGFTLVELVVVIAVIAILAAVSVGAYFGVTESANKSKLEQEAKQVYTAIQTVALAPNEHSNLDNTGITITNPGKFELALEESLGREVALTDEQDIKDSTNPTICFFAATDTNNALGNTKYNSFEYHVPGINGKKASVNVVTGDVNVAESTAEGGEIADHDKVAKEATVVIADYATANNWQNAEKYPLINMDENITVRIEENGNGNAGKYYDGSEWRFYQTENSKIIISGGYNIKLSEVKITYNVKNYGVLTFNDANVASDEVVTVSSNSVSFGVGNTTEATNGQIRITSIIVSYFVNLVADQPDIPVEPDVPVDPIQPVNEVSIEEAIAIAFAIETDATTTEIYRISGTVTLDGYKVYLTDGINQIQIYKQGDSYENLYEGYQATVEGKIMNYGGTNPKIWNYTLISFVPTTYSVTIPSFENGAISTTQISDISWGTNLTFTVTPNNGFKIESVSINGNEVVVSNNLFYYTIKKNIAIDAVFVAEVAGETEVNINFSTKGYSNGQEISSVEIDENISVLFDKGTNKDTPKYYSSGTAIRVYGGSYFKITSKNDKKITKVTITFGIKDGSNIITTDVGNFNTPNWSDEGQASVKFTIGGTSGNRRIQVLKITYTA